MSWAAKRETTRIEDQAYSLMGIFGVHMPPIYGEGNNAFLRLQEEIIRTIPDQTIFAWGRSCVLRSLDGCQDPRDYCLDNPCLLASSPAAFEHCRNITAVRPSHFASRLHLKGREDVPPLHCIITPQGIRVQLLCVNLATISQVMNAFWGANNQNPCADCAGRGKADVLAFLQCKDADDAIIALPLCWPRAMQHGNQYGLFVGTHVQCTKRSHQPFHTVRLSKAALEEALAHVGPVCIEVSLLRRHSVPPIPKSRIYPSVRKDRTGSIDLWPGDDPDGVIFHISPRSIASLATLGFVPSALQVMRSEREIALGTTLSHGAVDRVLQDGESQPTIQLRLVLRQPKSEHLWFLTLWDTEVNISATPVSVLKVRSGASFVARPVCPSRLISLFLIA